MCDSVKKPIFTAVMSTKQQPPVAFKGEMAQWLKVHSIFAYPSQRDANGGP